MGSNYAFLMMVKEKWWVRFRQRNQEGKKIHSFVIRGAAPPKNTKVILFYVTSPVREIGGYAEYIERAVGAPDELRNKYGSESVLSSKDEFEEFVGTVQKASFVRFKNLHEAASPITLSRLLMLLGVRRLSRKGFYVNKETADRLISMMESEG